MGYDVMVSIQHFDCCRFGSSPNIPTFCFIGLNLIVINSTHVIREEVLGFFKKSFIKNEYIYEKSYSKKNPSKWL